MLEGLKADNADNTWLAALLTVAVLLLYEVALLLVQRQKPNWLARSAHANLRAAWFVAISREIGSELLAVQTLRNALMSASVTASTAALGLVGAANLAAPSLKISLSTTTLSGEQITARLMLELTLMLLLFVSLVCSAMAVRYYNHAGFIVGMPVGSAERQSWTNTGTHYLRRAGLLYSWGLRHLVMVAPLLVAIVYPMAGPVAALLAVIVLLRFDRFHAG